MEHYQNDYNSQKITEKACVGAELGHFQLSKKAEAISPNLNSRKCPISAPRQAFSVIFLAVIVFLTVPYNLEGSRSSFDTIWGTSLVKNIKYEGVKLPRLTLIAKIALILLQDKLSQ